MSDNKINKHAFFEMLKHVYYLFIVKPIVHVHAARDGSVTSQQAH